VDQWVRIPRLPWEFWEADYLKELLEHVGPVFKIDQSPLLKLKGKFTRVCVNTNITKPLQGSIIVSGGGRSLRVQIIYEGLHEVCPLCGGDSHQLKTCPNLPVSKRVEVFVEKFDASGLTPAHHPVPWPPTYTHYHRELGCCVSEEKS